MIRGTTATFQFTLEDYTLEQISQMYIYFAQSDKVLLTKTKDDIIAVVGSDNSFLIKLTQAESKLFFEQFKLQIQLRCVDSDNNVIASQIFDCKVLDALNEEEIII